MNRIQKLQAIMDVKQLIISDPAMLYYYTGHRFDVGERMIALLVKKTGAPTLFLNKLFEAPDDLQTVQFSDSEDSIGILGSYLESGPLAIDGNWPARFVIPFITTHTLVNASPLLEQIRTIKDAHELALLETASHHNDRIMTEMRDLIKVGMTERELAEIVRTKQSTAPLQGPSFEPIVIFTQNIADPHGIPTDRVLQNGDVVLVDMGGFYEGYASDMTRCFFVGSNKELEPIYEIVRQANEAAIAAVKPGVTLASIDKAARDVITKAGYGEYFIHRTGHGIGTEAHENLDVSETNQKIVDVGMCFSIEPGIYLPGIGGIRIEDLVHVTADGVHVMNHFRKELTRI